MTTKRSKLKPLSRREFLRLAAMATGSVGLSLTWKGILSALLVINIKT